MCPSVLASTHLSITLSPPKPLDGIQKLATSLPLMVRMCTRVKLFFLVSILQCICHPSICSSLYLTVHMWTVEFRISLCICVVWSWPSRSTYRIIGYCTLYQCTCKYMLLDYAALMTDLDLYSLGLQHSFVEIDHEIFSTVILSLPWFKKDSCQFLVKEFAQYWLTAKRTKPAQ